MDGIHFCHSYLQYFFCIDLMQYNSAAACVYIMLECTGFLAESLFQFGGFGGNDYNIQLLELGLTVEQAMENTPLIVEAIVNGIEVTYNISFF